MAFRSLILGLAAAGVAIPAAAHGTLPAQTALGVIQNAQAATYSVRSVQDLLNRLGYDAGPADGIMGSRTAAAITAYQRDQGLAATGQPSAELYAHMLEGGSGGAATAPTTATTAAPGADIITSGQTVVDVQTELRRRGYDIDVITGEWDVPTRDAVLAYQRDAGMTATGTITEALAQSLTSSAATAVPSADQRALVRDIQTALSARGYNAGPADGTMSPLTQSAIRTYEADAGLPVTGAASPALLTRLEGGTGTPASQAEMVASVQEELIARGYLRGEADGVMGSATSAAIREFEEDAGLAVTGTPSETLLASLRSTSLTRAEANRPQVIAQIEEELRLKGYAVGPVDGTLDAQSETAIRTFQRDAGLTVDGQPSGRLLRTIRSSEVAARPMTREEAVQGLIQGATTRLLENLGNPAAQ